MPKKCRAGKRKKLLVLGIFSAVFLPFLAGANLPAKAAEISSAGDCPKLRVVFARGSGGVRWEDKNYQSFAGWIEPKLIMSGWDKQDYEFIDLDYPAIGMDIENFWAVLGAYFGAGDTYEFGTSVDTGVQNLVDMVTGDCPETKYVLGGYSQGAMVISKAIHSIPADRVIYAATFGDPKIYLPEGKGLIPAACRGDNLSDYRAYVPDCRAYEGLLGSYKPYQPLGYSGKLGTWCNKGDIFCSSHFNLGDHLAYANDDSSKDLYRDASKIISAKVNQYFGIENKYVSEHDTAFLIDSTASMGRLIDQYKAEALRLAEETLKNGGRVALYDYRDVGDGYYPHRWCNFETCTLESFQAGLEDIKTNGGGDTPESLLSSSLYVMKELNWNFGATKSLVVLTDADYHSPDGDGVTFDEVVALSKRIDPVNFYVITPDTFMDTYESLAVATDGMVVNSAGDLSILTRNIMERFDSLPRVEEDLMATETVPEISGRGFKWVSDSSVQVSWTGGSERTLLILNDYVLGVAEEKSVVLTGIDMNVENVVKLVPLGNETRGTEAVVKIEGEYGAGEITIPKAPNTGKLE